MKTLATTTFFALALLTSDATRAQTGHMMNESTWGGGWMAGYGVILIPLLLVLLGVTFLALVTQGRSQ